MGGIIAIPIYIKVKGGSGLFGTDPTVLAALPGQFNEASSWIAMSAESNLCDDC